MRWLNSGGLYLLAWWGVSEKEDPDQCQETLWVLKSFGFEKTPELSSPQDFLGLSKGFIPAMGTMKVNLEE
jgi:hypothetical protein